MVLLTACQFPGDQISKPAPIATPAPAAPSALSVGIKRYYTRLEHDQRAQGLLRTDGGGQDTPYDADTLARNFEKIAFFHEYANADTLTSGSGAANTLHRWKKPVRIQIKFGASVTPAQQKIDRATITAYAARLSRLTNHAINVVSTRGNFHVMILSEDERAAALPRIKAVLPSIDNGSLNVVRNLDRTLQCLVISQPDVNAPQTYNRAVAIVRAEHPDLLRKACFHEEIAQGLGLSNDSPRARPSIFNDDGEFALLTSHDEKLLKMLYDPRLPTGVTADWARPILHVLAREAMGPRQ